MVLFRNGTRNALGVLESLATRPHFRLLNCQSRRLIRSNNLSSPTLFPCEMPSRSVSRCPEASPLNWTGSCPPTGTGIVDASASRRCGAKLFSRG
jgi:hypothetical protein